MMKKVLFFALMGLVMVGSFTSCKNKNQEPTQEEVQEMKQAIADSVLAEIDALAEEYAIATERGVNFESLELTEKEKKVKPDYLLDPAEVNSFVTKTQKVNALAYYVVDLSVRKKYDMPLEETKAAIAKLALELNYPFDMDQYEVGMPLSERLRNEYDKCKENGDLAYFWRFQYAVITETNYIITQNPELFFSRISEEQWQCYRQKKNARKAAMETLAKYDEETASILELREKYRIKYSEGEKEKKHSSFEGEKQFRIAHKDQYIAKRNAMLQ